MKNPILNWRQQKQKYQLLGKQGRIVSFTKITNPPQGFGLLPYHVAIVDFGKQGKQTGQLVLEGKIPVRGGRVRAVLRIIGRQDSKELINYGVKFKLI